MIATKSPPTGERDRRRSLEVNGTSVLTLFLRSDGLYPVYRRLISMLGPTDLMMLSRTCKALSELYKKVIISDWNINKALRQFTDDPKRFRSVLSETNAVMSGSFALDLFDRNVTESSQLEIIMGVGGWDRTKPKDHVEWNVIQGTTEGGIVRRNNCEKLFRYLRDVEGYQPHADDQADDDAIFHREESRVDWVSDIFREAISQLVDCCNKFP